MSLSVIGKVLENKQIAENIFDMKIAWDNADEAKAGQFVNILCEGGDALLRRPISVCDAEKGVLRIVYEVKGKGTELLAKYEEGQSIDMLAPLGHGFTVKKCKNPVLIGGGIGTYPLLKLAKELGNSNVFLGFRSIDRITLKEDFEKVSKLDIVTDDGSFGNKMLATQSAEEFIKANGSEMIYACGPKPMLKAVAALAEKYGIECEVSMEERMGCGIGACLVCACKTKNKDGDEIHSHVCKDGPVFNSKDVIF